MQSTYLVVYYASGQISGICRTSNNEVIMEGESGEKAVLGVMESMLKAGLRAVRERLTSMGREEGERPGKERKSNTKTVADILREAGHPLHIDEIIRLAGSRGVVLHRESIVSALSKKLLEGKVFRRTGRNEFSLLEWEVKQHG